MGSKKIKTILCVTVAVLTHVTPAFAQFGNPFRGVFDELDDDRSNGGYDDERDQDSRYRDRGQYRRRQDPRYAPQAPRRTRPVPGWTDDQDDNDVPVRPQRRKAAPPQAPVPAPAPAPVQRKTAPPVTSINTTVPANVAVDPSPEAAAIRASLSSTNTLTIGSTPVSVKLLNKLYSLRAYRPFFIQNNALSPLAASTREMLTTEAEYHGFSSSNYFTSDLASRMTAKDLPRLVEAEILLANGYMQMANNMASGRINPRDKSQNLADIELTPPKPPALEYINESLASVSSMEQNMRRLSPTTIAYRELLKTLIRLKKAEKVGGWPDLVDHSVIKPGSNSLNVFPIRVRLVDMGALPKEERSNQSSFYDDTMVAGVKRLQKALFQKQDGVIGEKTFNLLDVPLENRIVQTKANLERWRLLPRDMGDRFIFVDLGRQEMDVMVDNKAPLRMRVVVGKDMHGTPTMIDQVKTVVVNPYWRPPQSIVVNEIIPAYLRDSSYFTRNNMTVRTAQGAINPASVDWSRYSLANPPPYEVRQETGPSNALGVLKFSLNNAHAIYMHDTDNKSVFDASIRYFSHGCIRVQKPVQLAAFLLSDQGYNEQSIQAEIADSRNRAKEINLQNPMRVYIFGTTMVAQTDGTIAFGEDVYKQDQRIVDAMNGVRSGGPTIESVSGQLERTTLRLSDGQ